MDAIHENAGGGIREPTLFLDSMQVYSEFAHATRATASAIQAADGKMTAGLAADRSILPGEEWRRAKPVKIREGKMVHSTSQRWLLTIDLL